MEDTIEICVEIEDYIRKLLREFPDITPFGVYENLLGKFFDKNDEEYPFTYRDAYSLDINFFNRGGGHWLDAFGRPGENSVVEFDGNLYRAKNCGIFTFDLVPL